MSREKEEILKKLKELNKVAPVIMPCVVKSVDETTVTCEVEIEGLEYTARLNAAQGSDKGFVVIPSVGSSVLAARLDQEGDTWVIIAFTAIDKIYMNNGENGGIPIVSKTVDRLNTIENDINNLKDIFKTTWVPVPQDGGAALKTAAASWAGQALQNTTDADIEDDIILH